MKYRKKPVVIDAIQFTGLESLSKMDAQFGKKFITARDFIEHSPFPHLIIRTLNGRVAAILGSYIIKGTHGEFYPCKQEIFEANYEKEKQNDSKRTNASID